MNFFSQRDEYYLIDQFNYWFLMRCMKTPAILKRQRFKDSESNETKSSRSKCQHLNKRDNEKRNVFNKDKDEIKGARYIPPLFIPLLLP